MMDKSYHLLEWEEDGKYRKVRRNLLGQVVAEVTTGDHVNCSWSCFLNSLAFRSGIATYEGTKEYIDDLLKNNGYKNLPSKIKIML